VKRTRLCELLGIEYPVIQAPMDWITDASLAAAVSDAGGLGIIGPNAGEREVTESVLETGERLRRQIRKAKGRPISPSASISSTWRCSLVSRRAGTRSPTSV
jgi:enoyl-[acyl-carrier protein] reductase II